MPDTIQTKHCSKCKQIKPISDFGKDKSRKDGHCHYCKECATNRRHTPQYQTWLKQYYQSEKYKIYQKSEKFKVIQRRYWQTEKAKEAHRFRCQCYSQTEKGKANHRKNTKQFNIRHPERYKAHTAVMRAIKFGKLPRPDTRLCHYCPKPAQEYHYWHGYAPEHWLDVVPVCQICHTICLRLVS